jgi:hypothetical protein
MGDKYQVESNVMLGVIIIKLLTLSSHSSYFLSVSESLQSSISIALEAEHPATEEAEAEAQDAEAKARGRG